MEEKEESIDIRSMVIEIKKIKSPSESDSNKTSLKVYGNIDLGFNSEKLTQSFIKDIVKSIENKFSTINLSEVPPKVIGMEMEVDLYNQWLEVESQNREVSTCN